MADFDDASAEYRGAVQFLLGRIDYERADFMPSGGHGLKLDRMRQLLQRLGNPHLGLPIIHIAGTKGKGSTAAIIAAALSAAGYRTGLFTSPHLERMEERICIDGLRCSGGELVGLVAKISPVAEAMDRSAAPVPGEQCPTYFEIITAMAMLHFAQRKVDAVVLEVGLGGRLDATNVCLPQVSVITSISFDHTQQLGNTLAVIAGEKAGIVKSGVPVVSGVTEEEPREVIREVCRLRGCRLAELQRDFDFSYQPPRHLEQGADHGKLDFRYHFSGVSLDFEKLCLSLPGEHQAANTAVALATLTELTRTGWQIPEEAIRRALAEIVWPARVEVVARRPAVVLDAAHNPASIAALLRTLDESFCIARRVLIFATTRDKDLRGMLSLLLGRFDQVVFTRYLNNPRAVPPEELESLAFELTGRRYPSYAEPAAAWEVVGAQAASDDLICITGSFFLAADMRRIIAARPIQPAGGPPGAASAVL